MKIFFNYVPSPREPLYTCKTIFERQKFIPNNKISREILDKGFRTV